WLFFFFFSSRRRHTRSTRDWSSDVCSSDLGAVDLGSLGSHAGHQRRAPLVVEVEREAHARLRIGRRHGRVDVARSEQRERHYRQPVPAPQALSHRAPSRLTVRKYSAPPPAACFWPRPACCRTAPPVHPSPATARASSARCPAAGRPSPARHSTRTG